MAELEMEEGAEALLEEVEQSHSSESEGENDKLAPRGSGNLTSDVIARPGYGHLLFSWDLNKVFNLDVRIAMLEIRSGDSCALCARSRE